MAGDEFELTQSQGGQNSVRKVAFSEVQSVRQPASKKKIAGFTILSVVVGAAVVFAVALHEVSSGVWH